MSLFPAYAGRQPVVSGGSAAEVIPENDGHLDWLQNPSFKSVDATAIQLMQYENTQKHSDAESISSGSDGAGEKRENIKSVISQGIARSTVTPSVVKSVITQSTVKSVREASENLKSSVVQVFTRKEPADIISPVSQIKIRQKEHGTKDENARNHKSAKSRKRVYSNSDSERSSSSSSDRNHSRHKKKKKKKHKHKGKHKHKKDKYEKKIKSEEKESTSKSAKKLEDLLPILPNKVFIEDVPGLKPEKAFRLDKSKDINNLIYGTIYKMSIPKYKRFGNTILGLREGQWISMNEKSKTKETGKESRYFGKENRSTKTKEKYTIDMSKFCMKRTKTRFSATEKEMNELYIPISKQERKPQDGNKPGDVNPLGVYDTATERYIQGKGLDVMEDEEEEVYKDTVEIQIQRRTAEYNRYLHENPQDVDKWLEFVQFQEEIVVMRQEDEDDQMMRQKQKDAVVMEMKAAVMEKAVEKNPASIRLKLEQMTLCRDIWDRPRLSKEWKHLTFRHPNNPDVWWRYLSYVRSNFYSFTVSGMIRAYVKCLTTLHSVRTGNLQTHRPLPNTERHMLGLFIELCLILWQAGHTEKCTALYQAMLEYNLNMPHVLQDASDSLEFLETFWDSSMPRVGENGAVGWDMWVQAVGEAQYSTMFKKEQDEVQEEEIIKQSRSKSETWNAMEVLRGGHHWLPWRPDLQAGEGEEDVEDPERLILFEDINKCLFLLDSQHNKFILLAGYLKLLGLNVGHVLPASSIAYQRLTQVRLFSVDDVQIEPGDIKGCKEAKLDGQMRKDVISNLLSHAVKKFSGWQRSVLTVAMLKWELQRLGRLDALDKKERKTRCKDVKKSAKAVLKEEENRNDLAVWEAYAEIEWTMGNVEDGRKVLETAFLMNTAGVRNAEDVIERCSACRLYRTYAELEMGLRQLINCEYSPTKLTDSGKQKVLYVLSVLGTGEQFIPSQDYAVPGTRVLKARKAYQDYLITLLEKEASLLASEGLSRNLPALQHHGPVLLHWSVCYAFYQYFTVDMRAANAVFQQVLDKICAVSGQKVDEKDDYDEMGNYGKHLMEELRVCQMRLVEYHTRTSLVPLRTLRTPLHLALQQLPDHPALLHMLISLETGGQIAGHLRRSVGGLGKQSHTPLVWIQVVMAELDRLQVLAQHQQQLASIIPALHRQSIEPWRGGVRYQMRAWFERALSRPTAQHSVLLWRLYMYCEIQQDQKDQAKSVFYRALQRCPWAKTLYLDCVEYFPEMLQEVTDIMTEKELRLRTPLEELSLLLANKDYAGMEGQEATEGQEVTVGQEVTQNHGADKENEVTEGLTDKNIISSTDKNAEAEKYEAIIMAEMALDVSSIPLPP